METTLVTSRDQNGDETAYLQGIHTVHPDLCFRDMANKQVLKKSTWMTLTHTLCIIEGTKWEYKISKPDLWLCIQQPQVSALIASPCCAGLATCYGVHPYTLH